jgi:hypothetical protein
VLRVAVIATAGAIVGIVVFWTARLRAARCAGGRGRVAALCGIGARLARAYGWRSLLTRPQCRGFWGRGSRARKSDEVG